MAPAQAAVKLVEPPPKAKWSKVDPSLFGMHVATVSAGRKFLGRLGGVRLWDAGVRWDQVEKQRGEFDWERLDTAVSTAQASGAGEIMYILGSTPEWAAKFVRPDTYYYGAGTASEPKKLAYWRVGTRRRDTVPGRITSYQIWNEANLASFYAPERPEHWKRMALLTDIAAQEIRKIDRNAKIVSASSTVIQGKKFSTESFFYRYLRSIRNRGVKLDAISVHLYPWTTKGPGGGTPQSDWPGWRWLAPSPTSSASRRSRSGTPRSTTATGATTATPPRCSSPRWGRHTSRGPTWTACATTSPRSSGTLGVARDGDQHH